MISHRSEAASLVTRGDVADSTFYDNEEVAAAFRLATMFANVAGWQAEVAAALGSQRQAPATRKADRAADSARSDAEAQRAAELPTAPESLPHEIPKPAPRSNDTEAATWLANAVARQAELVAAAGRPVPVTPEAAWRQAPAASSAACWRSITVAGRQAGRGVASGRPAPATPEAAFRHLAAGRSSLPAGSQRLAAFEPSEELRSNTTEAESSSLRGVIRSRRTEAA